MQEAKKLYLYNHYFFFQVHKRSTGKTSQIVKTVEYFIKAYCGIFYQSVLEKIKIKAKLPPVSTFFCSVKAQTETSM